MAAPNPPRNSGQLGTYRVPIEFEVSARNGQEAADLVDQALTGDAAPATPAAVQQGQVVLADGEVWGVLGWNRPNPAPQEAQLLQQTGLPDGRHRQRPLHELMTALDRLAATERPTDEAGAEERDAGPTRGLGVGMILHTAWGQSAPAEFADRNREILSRAIATLLYDTISDPSVYPGATTFLATSTAPEQWQSPQDVDAWLSALAQATSQPGAPHTPDGARGTVTRLLDERAEQLDSVPHAPDATAPMLRPGPGR
jgi:hypothetical protein